jgi:hypothetical protein
VACENWTSDTYALAAIALRAAFRDRDDVVALLDETNPPPIKRPTVADGAMPA